MNKELLELYISLQAQAATFKPGGTARVLFGKFIEIIDELRKSLNDLPKLKKKMSEYELAYSTLVTKHELLVHELEKLKDSSLPLKEYNKACLKLYKSLDLDGPEIKQPRDLTKFHDIIYAKFQENVPEPDLP